MTAELQSRYQEPSGRGGIRARLAVGKAGAKVLREEEAPHRPFLSGNLVYRKCCSLLCLVPARQSPSHSYTTGSLLEPVQFSVPYTLVQHSLTRTLGPLPVPSSGPAHFSCNLPTSLCHPRFHTLQATWICQSENSRA